VERPTAKFLAGSTRAMTHPFCFEILKLLQYILNYCIDMASKKRVVLNLNTIMKVIESSEKNKLTLKQILVKIKIGKTQVDDILKSKSDIKCEWLTGNCSMKRKLKNTGNEDINEIVWQWFICARTKNSVSGPMLQQKAK
jgi:hypothetical protein